jgi:hypothetical protein
MSRIDWQPLAVNDVSESAIRAQQMAGQTFQNAFSGLSGVINDWEGSQRDKNLAVLMGRQNQFLDDNDVDAYAAQLASGQLAGDLKYLKPQDLAAMRSFTGELRTGRQAEYTWDRGLELADREDKTYERGENERLIGQNIARSLLPLRLQAEKTGDRSAYDAQMATILEANPGATAAQIESMIDGGQEAVRAFRDTRNSDQSYRSTQYTFDRMLKSDAQKDRAAQILNEITRDNIDGVSALTTLNNNYAGEDAEVLNAIREAIPGMFATLDSVTGAPVGPAGEAGATGSFSAAGGSYAGTATNAMGVLNYNARGGGFSAVPDSVKTYADLDAFGTRMLGVQGVTSTASGPFQITRDTRREFGQRALGANWRTLPPTEENDDKIARAIFEDAKRKGAGAISGRWSAIDAGEARQLMAMPWEQARLMIARQEGGVVPNAVPRGSIRTSQQDLNSGLSVGTDGGFSGNRTALAAGFLTASQRPDADAQTIANELIGAPGPDGKAVPGAVFAGAQQHRIREDVEKLMNDTGVSASVAGWALSTTRRNRGWGERAFSVVGATGATAPDYNAAKARIMETRNRTMQDEVALVQDNLETQAAITAATAADTAARQQLANAEARRLANGGRGDVSRYVEAVRTTSAAVAAAQAGANRPGISRPGGERPAPAQRSYANGAAGAPQQSRYEGGPVARGPSVSFVAPPPAARRPAPRTSRIDRDEEYRRRVFGAS